MSAAGEPPLRGSLVGFGAAALLSAGALPVLMLWPRELDAVRPLTVFPIALVLAAIWEEALFRGVLLPAVRDRLGGRSLIGGLTGANLLTSLVFAAAHLFAHPPAMAPAYFGISLVLGLCRERSGGVTLPILVHVAFNIAWWRFA
jgi:membrane protease YdiL (CAAX protease family)